MSDNVLILESLFSFHDAILDEGRGMPAREVGETWKNDEGKEIVFEGVVLLPKEGGYKDNQILIKNIQDYLSKNNIILIKEINKPIASMLSAMIVVFTDADNKKIAWVKYFHSMPRNGFYRWPEADFTRDTGFSRGIGSAFLEKIPIQPSDLISDNIYRPVKQVVNVALKNAQSLVDTGKLPEMVFEHLKMVLVAAVQGQPSPVLKDGKQYAETYNKYLGEILAPISLVTGWLSSGDREASEGALLNGHKYDEMLIGYSQSKNEQLVDSNLVLVKGSSKKPDIRVGISSKAGSGAAASVRVFADIIKKIKNAPDGDKLLRKYGDLIRIILTIAGKDWFEGPLECAKILSLISSKEADMVRASKSLNFAELRKIKYTKNLLNIIRAFKGITPWEIKKLEPGYNPIFHIISGIAKRVVEEINKDSGFDKLIRELLNKSSMVQINSKISHKGNDCQFVDFHVKYPPVFEGRIVANSNKNYSATKIRGPISFKLK